MQPSLFLRRHVRLTCASRGRGVKNGGKCVCKESQCNSKAKGGRNLQVLFIMQSIQREITGSSSESCTYIKDAPDSPPAVAMEVAEM